MISKPDDPPSDLASALAALQAKREAMEAQSVREARPQDGSRPEAITEKVKHNRLSLAPPPVVLAVDDPRLRRMQFQAALRQPSLERDGGTGPSPAASVAPTVPPSC